MFSYRINRYVSQIKHNKIKFNLVPIEYHDDVLSKLPCSFFSKNTLKVLNVKMNTKVYLKYFNHIPLYSVNNKITWDVGNDYYAMPATLLKNEIYINHGIE